MFKINISREEAEAITSTHNAIAHYSGELLLARIKKDAVNILHFHDLFHVEGK